MKCPYCGGNPKLVGGGIIYPHRPDLYSKWFWQCAPCDAYVGCHPTGTGKKPLGRLADAELRKEKSKTHAAIDPYWKQGRLRRNEVYGILSALMNIDKSKCHVGMFDVPQCKEAQRVAGNTILWERK